MVLNPTGCVNSPIIGGAMACVFSSSPSLERLFRPFCLSRFVMSVLASVVSDGSPESGAFSEPLDGLSCVDDRSLLGG